MAAASDPITGVVFADFKVIANATKPLEPTAAGAPAIMWQSNQGIVVINFTKVTFVNFRELS